MSNFGSIARVFLIYSLVVVHARDISPILDFVAVYERHKLLANILCATDSSGLNEVFKAPKVGEFACLLGHIC